MKEVPPHVLELPLEDRALMALEAAVEKAFAEHARDGVPMYIWRDGKVVELSPKELRAMLAAQPSEK